MTRERRQPLTKHTFSQGIAEQLGVILLLCHVAHDPVREDLLRALKDIVLGSLKLLASSTSVFELIKPSDCRPQLRPESSRWADKADLSRLLRQHRLHDKPRRLTSPKELLPLMARGVRQDQDVNLGSHRE